MSSKSVLNEIAGDGWVEADPPSLDADSSVVAVVDGEPVKMGTTATTIREDKSCVHRRFRTGPYDVDVKIESADGQIALAGHVKVEYVDDYNE